MRSSGFVSFWKGGKKFILPLPHRGREKAAAWDDGKRLGVGEAEAEAWKVGGAAAAAGGAAASAASIAEVGVGAWESTKSQ